VSLGLLDFAETEPLVEYARRIHLEHLEIDRNTPSVGLSEQLLNELGTNPRLCWLGVISIDPSTMRVGSRITHQAPMGSPSSSMISWFRPLRSCSNEAR
jgi:hypothetical protein